MSSSICYITTTTTTTTTEPADLAALYSANNKKKKSSLSNRDAAKSCAVSYLTNLNAKSNHQTQHNQSMHTQKTDSNNNMLLSSTLDYLNELHQQQQQQHNSNIVIVNCAGHSIQNENDINLDILCRNSNGTSSATSSIISNGTYNERKISTTPPQQPSQKLKKKVQFISNEIHETSSDANQELEKDPVINLTSIQTDINPNTSSNHTITNQVLTPIQIHPTDVTALTNKDLNDENKNIPIFEKPQQQIPIRPTQSIIRNKNLMTNSLNRNFNPSPSSPYSYSFCLVNNNRQSSASYRTTNEQIKKSQTIPYLSSYSYAAAANRSYRNSDTKHNYQFVTQKQHYHQTSGMSTSSSFQRSIPQSPSFNNQFNKQFSIRSSMTMPVIHSTSDKTYNTVYNPNRFHNTTQFITQNEKDNPFRPEGELAKEAEEFVQKLKEKQEQDINQILNATVSSTTPLPSPNTTLKDVAVSLEQPSSPKQAKQQQSSPIKHKVDAAINLPTPPPVRTSNEPSPVKSNQNDNKQQSTTTNTPTNSNKQKEATNVSDKKKTKPKCGCVIS